MKAKGTKKQKMNQRMGAVYMKDEQLIEEILKHLDSYTDLNAGRPDNEK